MFFNSLKVGDFNFELNSFQTLGKCNYLLFVACILETGEVYCWGHGKKGQCGRVYDSKPQLKYSTPTKGD